MRFVTTLCLLLRLALSAENNEDADLSWFPKEWPEPGRFLWGGEWSAMEFVHDVLTERETPVAVFYPMNWHNLEISCVVLYSDWMDKLTLEEPPIRMPEDQHTSYHRMTCIIYARIYWFEKAGKFWKAREEAVKQLENGVGPDTLIAVSVQEEIAGCFERLSDQRPLLRMCLEGVQSLRVDLNDAIATASFAGAVVAEYIINDMRTTQRAWNWDGGRFADGQPCVNNCAPFMDWTGYTPVNSAHEIRDPKRWQPLMETNGLGYLFIQEHVTAQLSEMDLIIGTPEMRARRTPDPELDYEAEMKLVYQRMNEFSKDNDRIAKTKNMDNKLQVLIQIMIAIDSVKPWTLESAALFFSMFVTAEHDAVIMAWKEKLNWDLIRPTSVSMMKGGMWEDMNGDGTFTKKKMKKDKTERRRLSHTRGAGSGRYHSSHTHTTGRGTPSGSGRQAIQSRTITNGQGKAAGSGRQVVQNNNRGNGSGQQASTSRTTGQGTPSGSGRQSRTTNGQGTPSGSGRQSSTYSNGSNGDGKTNGSGRQDMSPVEKKTDTVPMDLEQVERVPWINDRMIDPKQWAPFIRVMPHSEYPSGSMAICQTVADFTKLFLTEFEDIQENLTIPWPLKKGAAGYGLPTEDVDAYTYSLAEFAAVCGESRLWGGMHFTKAVPAAKELVDGLGRMVFEHAVTVLNGNTLKPHVNMRALKLCEEYSTPDKCNRAPHCGYVESRATCMKAVCLSRKERKNREYKKITDRDICEEVIGLGYCRRYKKKKCLN